MNRVHTAPTELFRMKSAPVSNSSTFAATGSGSHDIAKPGECGAGLGDGSERNVTMRIISSSGSSLYGYQDADRALESWAVNFFDDSDIFSQLLEADGAALLQAFAKHKSECEEIKRKMAGSARAYLELFFQGTSTTPAACAGDSVHGVDGKSAGVTGAGGEKGGGRGQEVLASLLQLAQVHMSNSLEDTSVLAKDVVSGLLYFV